MSTENTATLEPVHEATPGDYEILYNESQQKIRELEDIVAASRIKPISDHPAKDARPGMTADALRAKVGDAAWSNMSKAQRYTGLGVDPSTVDEALLYRIWGRGAETSAGKDLFASNPLRYRILKECAKASNIFGASPKP